MAEHLQQAAAETSSDSSDRGVGIVGVGAVPAGQEKVLQEVRRKAVRPSQGGSGFGMGVGTGGEGQNTFGNKSNRHAVHRVGETKSLGYR